MKAITPLAHVVGLSTQVRVVQKVFAVAIWAAHPNFEPASEHPLTISIIVCGFNITTYGIEFVNYHNFLKLLSVL